MSTAGSGEGTAGPVTAAVAHNRPEPAHVRAGHALADARHASWVVGRMEAKLAKAEANAEAMVGNARLQLEAARDRAGKAREVADVLVAEAKAAGAVVPVTELLDPARLAQLELETGIPLADLKAAAERRAEAEAAAQEQADQAAERKARGKGGEG